jgi:hypothetical protein
VDGRIALASPGFSHLSEASSCEFLLDEGVVDEFTEDGDLSGAFCGAHGLEGVSDAEAESHGGGFQEFHGSPLILCKALCIAKFAFQKKGAIAPHCLRRDAGMGGW